MIQFKNQYWLLIALTACVQQTTPLASDELSSPGTKIAFQWTTEACGIDIILDWGASIETTERERIFFDLLLKLAAKRDQNNLSFSNVDFLNLEKIELYATPICHDRPDWIDSSIAQVEDLERSPYGELIVRGETVARYEMRYKQTFRKELKTAYVENFMKQIESETYLQDCLLRINFEIPQIDLAMTDERTTDYRSNYLEVTRLIFGFPAFNIVPDQYISRLPKLSANNRDRIYILFAEHCESKELLLARLHRLSVRLVGKEPELPDHQITTNNLVDEFREAVGYEPY